ncbi:MAG: class I SAM-dependent methyltransferase, partial [Armatimonadetes bacterium]|nr:class I SAM-dependent methyltransferase [Armatimonadota bacterium]
AMEDLLRPIVTRVAALLAGLDVVEVACGTGNWTQVLAKRVHSVVATDVSEETIRVAGTKEYPPGVVSFKVLDGYSLRDVGGSFAGAFAADWWSHVPRSLLSGFLDGLHDCLRPGAPVVFVDMLPRDHPDLTPYRHDTEGNAICHRILPDGREFDVVKNFPDSGEVFSFLSGRADRVEYEQWEDLGRWLVAYTTPAPSSD